jgi:predicted XRE-type DNA-binding protein
MTQNSNRTTTSPLGKVGSGNVFADFGLPNPDEHLLKAKLVSKISEVIDRRGLTQVEAGHVMDLPQSKVSELCNGRTQTYSVERLYRLLTRLGVAVSVVLEDQPDWSPGTVDVVEASDRESQREYASAPGM